MITEEEEPAITGKENYVITETAAMTEELSVIIVAADLVLLGEQVNQKSVITAHIKNNGFTGNIVDEYLANRKICST